MMHTLICGDIIVNHNSDWSGNVIVTSFEKQIELPGPDFYALAMKLARQELQRLGEDVRENGGRP